MRPGNLHGRPRTDSHGRHACFGIDDRRRCFQGKEGHAGGGKRAGLFAQDAAQKIIDAVVEKIVSEVKEMFREWEQEPAYRIWEIMKKEKLQAQNVVGVGGGARRWCL